MLISLPTAILTYRYAVEFLVNCLIIDLVHSSITTPHKLSYLNLAESVRILLTPTERRRPWIIYFTPGLLAAEVSHIAIVVLGLGPLRRVLVPVLSSGSKEANFSMIKFSIYLGVVALSTAILTPLEVIATRLAIQRNHAAAEYNSVSQEVEGDGEETDQYIGTEEDVIGYVLCWPPSFRHDLPVHLGSLRNERDPYLGLIDCGKRIIDEEGLVSLYRAWWITLLGGLGSAFV